MRGGGGGVSNKALIFTDKAFMAGTVAELTRGKKCPPLLTGDVIMVRVSPSAHSSRNANVLFRFLLFSTSLCKTGFQNNNKISDNSNIKLIKILNLNINNPKIKY